MTAVFLAFDCTRVAGDKARFFERWAEIRISFDQGAGNTMANSAGLSGIPATDDIHVDIEVSAGLSHLISKKPAPPRFFYARLL
jgi:hypothetical protein